ncbi:diguanylate cyclase [Vibrio panuliri]|uniref:diguanylate cyclase n=1 Tax=Vibrio panuliri TaxID=1381081 RepID=A0A1Q9HIZ1_9VIBR|nr:GGDEF domain-containing protein [Vibrio panuliri]OLQ90302.1 diguanylate cyclase [Vibrio panuliri]
MNSRFFHAFNHQLRPVFKLFLVTLVIVTSLYATYNTLMIKRLSKSIAGDFEQIYSIGRRFAQYYNNTNTTYLTKGTYTPNGVSVVVSQDTDVKILSTGINKMRSQLETIAKGYIWTIAIFEHPSNYGHFLPLRKTYEERYKDYQADNVMNRIVKLEGLENTFNQFYGCDIKLSEPYSEPGSSQMIRTVYYPVYNQKEIDALLAIDIKEGFIDAKIALFNDEFWTSMDSFAHGMTFRVPVNISCTDASPVYVGFKISTIAVRSLLPALLITLLVHLLMVLARRNQLRVCQDKMTGFYRRDFYEPRLTKLHTFSMLIIDIDFFKSINDTLGHQKGDDVIAEVTKRIASQVRGSDIAVRWGGEEFLLLFTDMEANVLSDKAEAIRDHVAKKPIAGLNVTISIGGVHLAEGSFADAYRMADDALYKSKQNGRNQVTILTNNDKAMS